MKFGRKKSAIQPPERKLMNCIICTKNDIVSDINVRF